MSISCVCVCVFSQIMVKHVFTEIWQREETVFLKTPAHLETMIPTNKPITEGLTSVAS